MQSQEPAAQFPNLDNYSQEYNPPSLGLNYSKKPPRNPVSYNSQIQLPNMNQLPNVGLGLENSSQPME